MTIIDNLTTLLDKGQDNALLRYSLGNEHFKAGDWEAAVSHLARALEQDPDYSAAWKIYGKALVEAGRPGDALAAFEQGIEVAGRKGDIQAAKEMGVFLKRARKSLEEN
jgi:Flp pilus assembly protein TadD